MPLWRHADYTDLSLRVNLRGHYMGGSQPTVKGRAVLEYLDLYPDLPSRTLAEKLLLDKPHIFKDLEAARGAVRYYRGATGKRQRKLLAHDAHVREPQEPHNPFADLPKPVGGWEELGVRKLRCAKAGIIADPHIPFHDLRATEVALTRLQDEKVDALIINGDLIDFYTISRWEKSPTITSMQEELEQTREFLRVLRREFPGVQIVWKLGNHDERWERYLQLKAPVLCDEAFVSYEHVFGLNELNIHLSPRTERIQVGQISVIHGHEFWGSISGAVNAARGLFLKAKTNAMCGHLHHTSEHPETNLEGKLVACWSLGALCQLHPYYAPINKWNHGFAIINNRADSMLSAVSNYKIIDGQVV